MTRLRQPALRSVGMSSAAPFFSTGADGIGRLRLPRNQKMNKLYESQLLTLCSALGWQGGTFHQVVAEVERMKRLEDAVRLACHGVPASSKVESPAAYYAIQVLGDVEPVLHGPFLSQRERDAKVGCLRLEDADDGLYAAEITAGVLSVDAYDGGTMSLLESRSEE